MLPKGAFIIRKSSISPGRRVFEIIPERFNSRQSEPVFCLFSSSFESFFRTKRTVSIKQLPLQGPDIRIFYVGNILLKQLLCFRMWLYFPHFCSFIRYKIFLSSHHNKQYIHIARRNTRYTACLSDRFRGYPG